MRLRSGECIGWGSPCGRIGPLAKPSLSLCHCCNRKRLEAERGPKPLPKKPLKFRRKLTGEGAIFKAVWLTRPHICVNCKEFLADPARSFYFAHIKPKSTHPELRLDIMNIMLLCLECHTAYDQGTKDQYEARRKESFVSELQ